MVTHTPTDPAQLELNFHANFPIKVDDLVIFPSSSGKWYHTRRVIAIDEDVLTVRNLHGAFSHGTDIMTVFATDVVAHYIHPSNISAENRELMDVNIYEHSVAETAKAKVRELEAEVARLNSELDPTRMYWKTRAEAAEAANARVIDIFTYEEDGRRWTGHDSESDVTDELQAALLQDKDHD